MKILSPTKRLARDLMAYRDVKVRKTATMLDAAKKAGCDRRTLRRRISALPPELTDRIDRLERLTPSCQERPVR